MVEGCVAGVYFPINYYECELHEGGCYKCENCNVVVEELIDEEMNPDGEHWVRFSYCTICGHGGNEPIAEPSGL